MKAPVTAVSEAGVRSPARRRLLADALRSAAALAGLAGIAALGSRGRGSEACRQPTPCDACALFARCGLPQARTARRDQEVR